MLHEALVGKNDDLGKTIHALLNFNKYVAILNKRGNIVLLNYSLRYVL